MFPAVSFYFLLIVTKQSKAEAALLATTLIWASTFVAMKIGLRDISPILMTGVRFTVATVIFLAIFAKKIFPLSVEQIKKGSLLGVFLFLGFIAQNVGLVYTTISKSAFITSLMVVFVPFFQYLIERRSPTYGNVLGIVIVLVGLWYLTLPSGSAFNYGDVLTLGCACMFGLFIVYLDIASKAMSPIQLTFLQFACTTILALGTAFVFEDIQFNPAHSMLIAVGYLTIFATVATTFIQTTFQKDTTPTRAAIIFTVEPVWASLYAYFLLGEIIGVLGILGGALIIVGVLVSQLSDKIPVLNKALVGEAS